MDLFGRKAAAQLEVAVAWITDLQGRLEDAAVREELLRGAKDRLAAQVHELDVKVRELSARPIPRPSAAPLYKTEEEEELEFALRNGDIDLQQFKDLMASQGFENAEVELPTRPERPIVY